MIFKPCTGVGSSTGRSCIFITATLQSSVGHTSWLLRAKCWTIPSSKTSQFSAGPLFDSIAASRAGCTRHLLLGDRVRARDDHRSMRVARLVHVVALRVTTLVFFAAFAADLVSKRWAVEHSDRVIFNHTPTELPFRLLMSFVAAAVGLVIARLALQRGLGRQWGIWIGCALLVAGTLANGVSPLLWDRGVPDFIDLHRGWSWNVADFEIAIGLVGGILSVALSAVVVYARERVTGERS
jgi:hypothetical protein